MQALPAPADSLCIVVMGGGDTTTGGGGEGEAGASGSLYLNIGLQNGVLLRTVLDQVTGDLTDTRTRYLGSRPVKLFRIKMQGSEAVSLQTLFLRRPIRCGWHIKITTQIIFLSMLTKNCKDFYYLLVLNIGSLNTNFWNNYLLGIYHYALKL